MDAFLSFLGGSPSGLELHAGLFLFCRRHHARLQNLLDQTTHQELLRFEQRFHRGSPDRFDGLFVALREAHDKSADRFLVVAAAALCYLDQRHARRPELAGAKVALSALGAGEQLFLPPAFAPWLVLPESGPQRIARDAADATLHLPTLLGLDCRFVECRRENGLNATYCPFPAQSTARLRAILGRGELNVGFAAPHEGLSYDFDSRLDECNERGTPYRFVKLKAEARALARQAIDRILEACLIERIDWLLFPELTLDDTVFRYLCDRLRDRADEGDFPSVVQAGSFHFQGDDSRWRNRASLLDAFGEEIFRHDKLLRFELKSPEAKGPIKELLGIDDRGGREDIAVGDVLTLTDTPFGRLTTLICLDYCGDIVSQAGLDAGIDIFLVPAMTPSVEPFHEKARRWGQLCRATSLITNSAWLLKQLNLPDAELESRLIAAYLPIRGKSGLVCELGRFVTSGIFPDLRTLRIRVESSSENYSPMIHLVKPLS